MARIERILGAAASALVVACGAGGAVAGMSAGFSPDSTGATERDLSIAQKPVYAIAPQVQPSHFRVKAIVDHWFGRYHVGEAVGLKVWSNEDAYITVVDVGTSGAVTVLFPNANDRDNHIRGGETRTIAGQNWGIQAGGPNGVEVIKVFASKSPKSVFTAGQFHPAGPFRTLQATPDTARDLSIALNQSGAWTVATKLLKIVGAQDEAVAFGQAGAPSGDGALAPSVYPGSSQVYGAPAQGSLTFGLRLDVARQDGVYAVGEDLHVTVTSEQSCHLTLYDVGSSGRTTILFPNRLQQNTLIPAGRTVVFPALDGALSYQVGGPEGVDQLVAICSQTGPWRPIDWNWGNELFHTLPVDQGDSIQRSFNRDLSVVSNQSDEQTAFARASFRVVLARPPR